MIKISSPQFFINATSRAESNVFFTFCNEKINTITTYVEASLSAYPNYFAIGNSLF